MATFTYLDIFVVAFFFLLTNPVFIHIYIWESGTHTVTLCFIAQRLHQKYSGSHEVLGINSSPSASSLHYRPQPNLCVVSYSLAFLSTAFITVLAEKHQSHLRWPNRQRSQFHSKDRKAKAIKLGQAENRCVSWARILVALGFPAHR